MEVQLIRSAIGDSQDQFLASTVINQSLAIDAGCIGLIPLPRQRAIRHVLLTHVHLDHVATLPTFLDNVFASGLDCPTVYGTRATWEALRADLFNGRIWPDLAALATAESKFLEARHFESGVPTELDGLRVTPVDLDHTVPAVGFLVEEAKAAIAFVSDTGPTAAIWETANKTPHLKAVFLEASFPNRLQWLAERSMHLTPALLAAELEKLRSDVRVIVIHMKAAFRREIAAELGLLKLPHVEVGMPGQVYKF